MALAGEIRLTPPPKPIFEEKMLFALLWNRNLRGFWRQELGERFLSRLQRLVALHLDGGSRRRCRRRARCRN